MLPPALVRELLAGFGRVLTEVSERRARSLTEQLVHARALLAQGAPAAARPGRTLAREVLEEAESCAAQLRAQLAEIDHLAAQARALLAAGAPPADPATRSREATP